MSVTPIISGIRWEMDPGHKAQDDSLGDGPTSIHSHKTPAPTPALAVWIYQTSFTFCPQIQGRDVMLA